MGIEDLDVFLRIVEEKIESANSMAEAAEPPDHREGRFVPALRAVWRWNRRRVANVQRVVERIKMPVLDRAGDVDDQLVEVGVGPTFHRRYQTVVRGGALGAEEAMAAIQADPNVLADLDLAPFTKVRGEFGGMRVGDRYVIEITGPWKGAVEVIDVSPRSVRFATLEGHMESGIIEMTTSDNVADRHGAVVAFTIESWARSHDHFLDVMHDKLGIAKALRGEIWSIACDRFTQLVQGQQVGPLKVVTERTSRTP